MCIARSFHGISHQASSVACSWACASPKLPVVQARFHTRRSCLHAQIAVGRRLIGLDHGHRLANSTSVWKLHLHRRGHYSRMGFTKRQNRGISMCLVQWGLPAFDFRHRSQISSAIWSYRSSWPASSTLNQRTNSSWTTLLTASAEWHDCKRGRIVPTSGSYSSALVLKLIEIGSCRKSAAEIAWNRSPYSSFKRRRKALISFRSLVMGSITKLN
jgi:hypothetical protein